MMLLLRVYDYFVVSVDDDFDSDSELDNSDDVESVAAVDCYSS